MESNRKQIDVGTEDKVNELEYLISSLAIKKIKG